MADDERKLPDLVARVRTVYDGTGIEEAKKEAKSLGDELDKAGQSNAPLTMEEKWARTQARLDAAKNAGKEAGNALDEAGKAGVEAGEATTAGLGEIAGASTIATTAILAGKLALDAFNQAGAEGKLSGEQLEQYRELRAATDDLHDSLNELAASGGAALASLVEPLASVADGLTEIANWKPPGATSSLATIFIEGVEPVTQLGRALDFLGIGGDKAAETEDELADRTKRANEAFEEQQKQADATAKAMDDLAQAQVDQVDAGTELEHRQRSLADSQDKVAEAEKKVADLRAGNRTEQAIAAADKLRDAQERLADAHRKVAEASLTVADKEDDLREAEFRQGVQSEEAIKARRAVESAKLDKAKAEGDVTDAAGDVTKARGKLDELTGPAALAKAEKDLADARDDAAEKAQGVAKATADLAEAQAKANGQVFTGQDRVRVYKEALGHLADDIGGPVGEKVRGLAGDIRSVNDAMTSIIQQIPTIEPLFGMDFASGGAVAPKTAASAPRSPVTTGGAVGVAAQNVVNQNVNITVPTNHEAAKALDDELAWRRAHFE